MKLSKFKFETLTSEEMMELKGGVNVPSSDRVQDGISATIFGISACFLQDEDDSGGDSDW